MKRFESLRVVVVASLLGIAALILTSLLLRLAITFPDCADAGEGELFSGIILFFLMVFYVGFLRVVLGTIVLSIVGCWVIYGIIKLAKWYHVKYVLPKDGKRVVRKENNRLSDYLY